MEEMSIASESSYTVELMDTTGELKKIIDENSRVIRAHSSKFIEIGKDIEGCENIIKDILEYINDDLYDWVVKTEKKQNNSDRAAILVEQRLQDVERNQDETAKLVTTLCVNTYPQLKDISSFISVLYVICGALTLGFLIALINLETPEYVVAFAMMLVCTITLVYISIIIKKLANLNRFVYRALYTILGEDKNEGTEKDCN